MSGNIEQQMNKILDEYLEGNISEAEVKAIHQRLQVGDPMLDVEQELERIKLPADLLVSAMATEPSPQLPPNTSIEAYLGDRYLSEQKEQIIDRRKALQMAQRYALVGVILFAVVLLVPMMHLFLPFSSTDPLFDKYFELPPMAESLVEQDDPKIERLWTQAFDYYGEGAFTPAINTLHDVVKLEQSPEADFYIGVAYLAKKQQQARLAIEHLKQAQQKSELFASEASWYLALAHLKNGSTNTSQDILETLMAEAEVKEKAEAKKLLQSLKQQSW